MTREQPRGFVVVDTTVLSYFTRQMPLAPAYREMLAGRTIGLSYFVRAELEGATWDPPQRERLDAMYEESVELTPGAATTTWYNRGHAERRRLKLTRAGRGRAQRRPVGDTDLWIIAHAAEYEVPYMSHDRSACKVADALGVEVLTALDV